jgi:hypothetical protein
MSRFVLNKEKILNNYSYAAYDTNFWLYEVENVPVSAALDKELGRPGAKALKNFDKSCFAELPSNLAAYVKSHKKMPGRIMFRVNPERHARVQLTKKEIIRWITLCKEHKLMPKNIGPLFLKTMFFIIRNPAKLNIQQIYLYLMSARYIQEEPYVVKTILYLIDEGVDFWIALSVAVQVCGANAGHAYLPVSKGYSSNCRSFDPNQYRYDLSYAKQFRIFLEEDRIASASRPIGELVDEVIKNSVPGNGYYTGLNFRFHDSLSKVIIDTSRLKGARAEDLKNPEIVKIVYTS